MAQHTYDIGPMTATSSVDLNEQDAIAMKTDIADVVAKYLSEEGRPAEPEVKKDGFTIPN